MRSTCIIILFMIFVVSISHSNEYTYIVPSNESLNINIDGRDNEWIDYKYKEYPIKNKYQISKGNTDTTTASFKIMTDKIFLYICVVVSDDKYCIKERTFGEGWLNDAIEICFDGDLNYSEELFDSNDGQIVIVSKFDNSVQLEGNIPFLYFAQIPYFWEERGVKAAFNRTNIYNTYEVQIPISLFQTKCIEQAIGLNIRVFDNDDIDDQLESVLSWCDDKDMQSYWNKSIYNKLLLTNYDIQQSEHIYSKLLNALQIKNYEIINNIIESGKLSIPLSVVIELQNNKLRNALESIQVFVDSIDNDGLKKWALEYPSIYCLEITQAPQFKLDDRESNYSKSAYIMNYIYKNKDKKYKNKIIYYINNVHTNNNIDIYYLDEIINSSNDSDIIVRCKIALAKIYLYRGNNNIVTEICSKYINSSIDDRDKLDFELIIESMNEGNE